MFDFSLKRDNLYQQVADRLQQLIVADSLRPGDKLPGERELAERMGVSRTVIREAIRVLSDRGLVRAKSGCGTYVQKLSPKDATASIELFLKLTQTSDSLQEAYEVRRMIETEAAALAATRATEEDLAALESALAEMIAHQEDPEAYTEHDVAFHQAIAQATHNDLFIVLLNPLSDLLIRIVRTSLAASNAAAQGIAHHRNILSWIVARDAGRAREAMRDHVDHAQKLVETVHAAQSGDGQGENLDEIS